MVGFPLHMMYTEKNGPVNFNLLNLARIQNRFRRSPYQSLISSNTKKNLYLLKPKRSLIARIFSDDRHYLRLSKKGKISHFSRNPPTTIYCLIVSISYLAKLKGHYFP